MKKRVSLIRVNTKKSHSDSILRNLLYSLLLHGKVETTSSRAKKFKRYADRELSYALTVEGESVKNSVVRHVGSMQVSELLLAYRACFKSTGEEIHGGRTSLHKTRNRDGDNSEMTEVVLINFAEFAKYLEKIRPKKIKKKKAKKVPAKKEVSGKKEVIEKKKEPIKKSEPSQPKSEAAPPEKRKGFLAGLRGRILGRKVRGPELGGNKGRSTARSGI